MKTLSLVLAVAISAATTAAAQDRQAPAEKDQRPPTLAPLPPSQGEGSGSSLSDRLSKSGGVIQPPASADSEMKVIPPPDAGSSNMPVVPPPGTPGSTAPDVKPK
jgi:hypothetical protein